jgi:hypothetical protein
MQPDDIWTPDDWDDLTDDDGAVPVHANPEQED